MKRPTGALVAVALAIVALTGCEPLAAALVDELFVDYPYIEEPLDEVWKRADAFRYEAESGSYWKSPREMDAERAGDCEDFSAWMVYHLGREASLAILVYPDADSPHAVVYYHGAYLEPQHVDSYKDVSTCTTITLMSYEATMKVSTALYTK